MELSKILGSPTVQGEVEEEFVECDFIPERLEFTFPPGTQPDIPESVQEKMPREVRVLTLNTAGRSYVSGGLVDVCLNLALQATMAPSATGQQTWPVIYQPVSQPNCYKGRCGPGCCTTAESIAFLSSLFPSPSSSSPQEEDLIPAFEKYLSRRRDVISAARTGKKQPLHHGFALAYLFFLFSFLSYGSDSIRFLHQEQTLPGNHLRYRSRRPKSRRTRCK